MDAVTMPRNGDRSPSPSEGAVGYQLADFGLSFS